MSPYPGSGTFDSRIFDAGAGQTADWGALSWNSGDALGNRDRDQRPHRQHAHARRDLERVHPDRLVAAATSRATAATSSTGHS